MSKRGLGSAVAAVAIAASTFGEPISVAQPAEPPADAQPAKVVIVTDPNADAIVARIEAELRTLGFTVSVIRAGAAPIGRESLEASARAAGAAAAIRVAPANGGVDVWVVDRVTGKASLRSVSADDAATIAIRAVELLRASLLETTSPHASRGEVAPDATVRSVVAADRAPAEPPAAPKPLQPRSAPTKPVTTATSHAEAPPPAERRELGLRVAPGFAWSGGGLASSSLLEIDGRIRLTRAFDLAVFATIPFGSVSRETAAGNVTALVAFAGVGMSHAFTRRDAWWIPSLGAGLGGSWLHVSGTPRSTALGSDEDSFAAVPYLAASFAIAPISLLRIGPAAFAGVAIPRTEIEAVGRSVATFGRPILEGSFGVELVTR